ncbi:MAG: hypothetical protein HC933_03725 [Pleurocapsa sp. SU_196_0]|nr:hypothetical protein [Pleurocapsa sp. SU_196_0]
MAALEYVKRVFDSGAGIPEAEREAWFTRFRKGEHSSGSLVNMRDARPTNGVLVAVCLRS